MSKAYITKALRQKVAAQARYRCGYCLTSERIVGVDMDIEHIVPEARGGETDEGNLWLACARCNEHKSDRIEAADPQTGELVPLYHPRQQDWADHFVWSPGGDRILGLTPTGRATVVALRLNREKLVEARREWVRVGWHPPKE